MPTPDNAQLRLDQEKDRPCRSPTAVLDTLRGGPDPVTAWCPVGCETESENIPK